MLNISRQLMCYFSWFLLTVAFITPTSFSLVGSRIIGILLSSWKSGTLIASMTYPSYWRTWWVGGDGKASFVLSFWQRYLYQSVCLLGNIGFTFATFWRDWFLVKAKGLSLYHFNQSEILHIQVWDTTRLGDLQLARSLIRCHLIPAWSVRLAGKCT